MRQPQGTCPVCSRVVSLYRNGTLHDHGTGYSAFCSGARRLPKEAPQRKVGGEQA
jgi:hypothetical protein